jgi:hypothetical protein
LTANTEETAIRRIVVNHANDHHTKTAADLGEYKAIVDLHERGYIVSNPLTEHAPFDLIIWKNGEASTVQVKYRSKNDGKINVRFRATQWNTDGSYNREIDKAPIDIYCVYCPESDECYYFDPDGFDKSATFRIDPPKNGQSTGVHFAEDYKRVP